MPAFPINNIGDQYFLLYINVYRLNVYRLNVYRNNKILLNDKDFSEVRETAVRSFVLQAEVESWNRETERR